MDECLVSPGKAKLFSILNASSEYWQIEMDEKDIAKMAFVVHDVLYKYTRIPSGMKNAPETF